MSSPSRFTKISSPLLNTSILPAGSQAQQEDAIVLFQLMGFILSLSTGRQVYLLYDEAQTDLGVAARSCFQAWTDTTLMRYDPDLVQLESFLRSSDHALAMRNVVVFCSRDQTLHLFQQVRSRVLESTTVQWFVVVKEDVTTALQDLLREGTQMVLMTQVSTTDYTLATTRVNTQGQVRLESGGRWRWEAALGEAATYFSLNLVPDLLELYSDFQGRQLVVSANDNWPFFGLTALPDGSAIPNSGIDVNILNTLSSSLNFTYQLVVPEDKAWGGPQEDGSVTGLIGMVARQEAQLAICEITVTDMRETVVDFTATYWLESLTVVSRAPKEKDSSMSVFWPFSTMVWVYIVVSTGLVGPVGWLVWRWRVGGGQPPLYNVSFNMFRSLMVQGNQLPAVASSLRILFIFWYFFCYNIYAMYTGVLTAVLAVPAFEKPVEGLADLPSAVRDGFVIGTLKDSSTEFLFRKADSGIYWEVWQLFHPVKSLLQNPEIGFDKVLTEKFVLINSELNAKIRATVRGRRRYHFGRDTFYPHGYAIACTSGAPFRFQFDRMLTWVTEAGLVNYWAEKEVQKLTGHKRAAEGDAEGDEESGSLTLSHLQAAFYLLMVGAVVSALALLLEVSLSR